MLLRRLPCRRPLVPVLAAVLAGVLAACGSKRRLVQSGPTGPSHAVDGERRDWSGELAELEDEGVWAGFRNGDRTFRIAVVTDRRETVRQIVRGGLTVWVDSAGGTTKRWGVRYPAVAREGEDGGGDARGEGRRAPRAGRAGLADVVDRLPDSVEVVRTGGPSRVVAADGTRGLEGEVGLSGRVLTVELEIPMQASGPGSHAPGIAPGDTVGVGIEAGGVRLELSDAGGPGAGLPGGGRRPGGVPGGQGRARGGIGDLPSPAEPLEAWVRVAVTGGGTREEPAGGS